MKQANVGRTITLMSLLTLAVTVLSGCSGTNNDSNGVPSPSQSATSSESGEPLLSDYVVIESQTYSVSNRSCDYSDGTLEMKVRLKNVSDLEIKAIDASGIILDSFGEEINSWNLDDDRRVKPGESMTIGSYGSYCYSLDGFQDDEQRLMDMDDLENQTSLLVEINKIAFVDGDIVEF